MDFVFSAVRTHMDVLMEAGDGSLQVFHGHQHVLHHMVLLVETTDGFALRQLQQRDLGGHHPAKHQTEQGVVPERNDILRERKDRQRECGIERYGEGEKMRGKKGGKPIRHSEIDIPGQRMTVMFLLHNLSAAMRKRETGRSSMLSGLKG